MKRPSKHLNTIRMHANKKTMESESVVMPYPEEVMIVVPQYAGDSSVPIVEVGTYVTKGQRIAEAPDSMPAHSSVSGTVTAISEIRIAGEDRRTAITIATDDKDKLSEYIEVPNVDTRKTFINWLKRSGIMNNRFPVYKMLEREGISKIYVVATEYEPVVTAGYRCLIEDVDDILYGIKMMHKYMDIPPVMICIENNKLTAIDNMERAIGEKEMKAMAFIKPVTPRYVQRNRKILIYELTGQQAEQQRDSVFLDVAAVADMGRFFRTGIPVITRRVTVEGDIVGERKNVIAPIGAHIADVVDFCGGYKVTPRKILDDGTMNGRCLASDKVPVMKDMNAIIPFEGRAAVEVTPKKCIGCRECFLGCPLKLYPMMIEEAVMEGNIKMLKKLQAGSCVQCGSCTYSCPSKRPLMKTCAQALRMLSGEGSDE